MSASNKPITIGVFGGSFNPIHLGHALLAITTQQTKNVDSVVLVPVYQHAVKRDLLPFADRVTMCRLAVATFGEALTVSTIEEETGASNGAMLRALKLKYPEHTKFLWICGDDFIRWMDRPAGMETLKEVSGIIVQRRLHKQPDSGTGTSSSSSSSVDTTFSNDQFFKEPVDMTKIRKVALQLDLSVDFIYGELPHFSSTLVRRAPGHWRSFLGQSVVQYLDARPHLLQQLLDNLEVDAEKEQKGKHKTLQHALSTTTTTTPAAETVLHGLDAIHALQYERGRTGLHLSMATDMTERLLVSAQASTDACLLRLLATDKKHTANKDDGDDDDVGVQEENEQELDDIPALAAELKRIPVWLLPDRRVVQKRSASVSVGTEGWLARAACVEKFNPRIDVLIGATVRALAEILEHGRDKWKGDNGNRSTSNSIDRENIPELLFKWCEGKEALGRLRAFVCAGGPTVPFLVRRSFILRQRLNQTIEHKERCLARVLSLQADMSSRLSAPEALFRMLENVTQWELSLMGCFSSSTSLSLVHKVLLIGSSMTTNHVAVDNVDRTSHMEFDAEKFFGASSAAIDFLLSFAKALAASACAGA
jgi:nicotinate (nicotinamide) nucleotide adenylyltransferase